jgi:tetratricopeptide (TPR) repeat protein
MQDHKIEIWNQLATIMMGYDLHEEAVHYLNKILAVDPGNDGSVEVKANALEILGNIEEALECLSDYLESDSSAIYLWILKGDLLDVHYRDYRGAIDCYDQALKVDPKNEEAWAKKAYALKETGEYTAATTSFKTALQLFDENFDLKSLEYYRELCEEYNDCLNLGGISHDLPL